MGAHKSSDMANLPHLPNSAFVPVTEAEIELVRAQLGRILSGAAFQNSKRYAAVLKFIVEQTLEGEGERLKERTIGIEVFNRAPITTPRPITPYAARRPKYGSVWGSTTPPIAESWGLRSSLGRT